MKDFVIKLRPPSFWPIHHPVPKKTHNFFANLRSRTRQTATNFYLSQTPQLAAASDKQASDSHDSAQTDNSNWQRPLENTLGRKANTKHCTVSATAAKQAGLRKQRDYERMSDLPVRGVARGNRGGDQGKQQRPRLFQKADNKQAPK